jgi:hypothetical protein
MTIEDVLELYESQDGEVEELLAKVIHLRRMKARSGLPAAEAYLRFERSIALLRELDEEMDEARCDLICARRRIRALFGRGHQGPGRLWQLRIAWAEVRKSCSTYRLYAARAFAAGRAALSIIFLR